MRSRIRTEEEKIAKQLANIVNDLTVDLDQVGVYLARNSRNVSITRLNEVIESANYEKEQSNVRINTDTISDQM
jgi:hypothetical protein